LDELTATSVAFLRSWESFAIECNPSGYYGAFSGGKDSCVIKELARLAGVRCTWHYSVTTVDPPELVRFIRREHPDVEWRRPKKAMTTRIAEGKGLPMRNGRWCCKEYKETGGRGSYVVSGIRANESARRAANWKEITPLRGGGVMVSPIYYWTTENVWDFIRSRKLPYCELYDRGFKRLGCLGCPMNYNKARDLDLYPRYKANWRRAAVACFDLWKTQNRDTRTLRLFPDGNAWFEWWLSNESMPTEDDDCPGLNLY